MSQGRRAVTAPRLSRAAGDAGPAAPVRIVHLGLGNFFRAHQAFYTSEASDADAWGIAAFTGRSGTLADDLAAQDGLYTLIVRGADHDDCLVLGALSAAHIGTDAEAWRGYLSRREVAIVTLTVTEAGYLRDQRGALDVERADFRADVAAFQPISPWLCAPCPAGSWPGLPPGPVNGGPLAVVSCDNLPDNGAIAARVVAGSRTSSIRRWPPGSTTMSPSLPPWSTGSRRGRHRRICVPSPS